MIKTVYKTSDGQIFDTSYEAREHEFTLPGDEYKVELHFTGCYSTVVRAHSKKEAFEKAEKEWKFEDLLLDIDGQRIKKVE